jgi:hypothetical protein
MRKNYNPFPLRSVSKQMFTFTSHTQYNVGSPSQTNKVRERNRDHPNGKEGDEIIPL